MTSPTPVPMPRNDKTRLVSIIIPVYNDERYLRRSLDSILAQTYPNTEVIVLDDASTDGTPEIIAEYGNQIRSHRQARNRGIFGNMNDGIAMAQGEFIAIYHSDDVYDQRIVEREVGFLDRYPEVAAVFCKEVFIDPQGREFGRLELPREVRGGGPFEYATIFNALLTHKNHIFCCPTCMVRASAYRVVGPYRDQFRITSDLEMYLRSSRHYQVGILDDYLISYRSGHGNSSQKDRYLKTDANGFFAIMDLHLASGGRTIATPKALRAYEAHRAEDNLLRSVNCYILDRRRKASEIIKGIRIRTLLFSRRIMRWRLLLLFFLLRVLVLLPRAASVANLFHRRWHSGIRMKKTFGWQRIVVSDNAR